MIWKAWILNEEQIIWTKIALKKDLQKGPWLFIWRQLIKTWWLNRCNFIPQHTFDSLLRCLHAGNMPDSTFALFSKMDCPDILSLSSISEVAMRSTNSFLLVTLCWIQRSSIAWHKGVNCGGLKRRGESQNQGSLPESLMMKIKWFDTWPWHDATHFIPIGRRLAWIPCWAHSLRSLPVGASSGAW